MRERLTRALAVLGGLRPLDEGAPRWVATVAIPLWWVTLILVALAFAGQSIKFVYIDF